MKINLNKPLKDLEGKDIENGNMGKLLANVMVGKSGSNDIIKIFELAQKFYRGENVELDTQDLKLVKDIVEKAENLSLLAKAQILKELS